ncbi:solute carrier family 23 protein [Bauldia sp.]|uniref:solute carrier family 23 protein n=1 Tax=Bauldia sp. TaxID=2575872 RepID=UPI003BA8EF6A
MTQRPPDLLYAVDERPPWPKLVLLGLQFSLLLVVPLVLLVIVLKAAQTPTDDAHSYLSFGLLALALGTIFQAYNGRWFGSGYLAPPVFSAIYIGPALLAAQAGGMPAVAAMTIFAGLVEMTLARLLPYLRLLFQPLIGGLIVLVVGIELGLIGLDHLTDVRDGNVPDYGLHLAVAALCLATAIGLSVWGRGVFRLMCSLFALIVGVIAALAVGLIAGPEINQLSAAAWFALPDFGVLAYDFDPALLPSFLVAAVAAAVRVTGVIASAQRINDAKWKRPEPKSLQRGMFADGMGAAAAGLLGVLGTSAAPSIVGLSMVTGATSRAIAYAAAIFLIVFALTPKVAAFMIGLPPEVFGALILFNGSLMIVSGFQILAPRGLTTRTGFVLSLSLLLGLLARTEPQVFATLPEALRLVTGSLLTVALTTAIVLSLVFRLGIRRRETEQWRGKDGEPVNFETMLRTRSHDWKVDDETIDRAEAALTDVIRHIQESGYLDQPISLDAAFDELELEIEIAYRGRPIHPARTVPMAHHVVHEESAAAGMSAAALAAEADRTSVTMAGDEVRIKLWFTA